MDIQEGRIRADRLDIECNQVPFTSNEQQRVTLSNIATLPQKIKLWLIVGRSLGSLISNFTFICIICSFTFWIKIKLQMSAKVLSKIYHDPKIPGSLSGVERLLRRARQLHVPGVTRKTVQEYLRSKQAYMLHKPARRQFTKNHTYVAGIDGQ